METSCGVALHPDIISLIKGGSKGDAFRNLDLDLITFSLNQIQSRIETLDSCEAFGGGLESAYAKQARDKQAPISGSMFSPRIRSLGEPSPTRSAAEARTHMIASDSLVSGHPSSTASGPHTRPEICFLHW